MKKALLVVLAVVLLISLSSCERKTQSRAEGEVLIAFANLADTFEFCQSVRRGFEEECAKRGWKIATMDNNLSGTTAIANARNVVSLGADFFVEFNPDSTVGEAIMDIINEAGIPTIAIDIPLPNVPYFGANNFVAGETGGVTLAEIGMREFGPDIDSLVVISRPDGGELIIERQDGIIAGVKTLYPNLPDNRVFILDGHGDVLPSQEAFTSFLSANPNARRILVGAVNDQCGQGALAAAEIANRQDHVLIISQGCDSSALDNLRLSGTNAWRGSVSYAPENYGRYAMPTIELMLKGESYPMFTYVEHFTVTKDNINQVYPK